MIHLVAVGLGRVMLGTASRGSKGILDRVVVLNCVEHAAWSEVEIGLELTLTERAAMRCVITT